MNDPISGFSRRLSGSSPQWWLGVMLFALHYSLAWGIDDWLARAMLLAHFGLFLLWQPVWRGERRIESRHAFLVVIVGLLLVGWNNWWLMAVWVAVLFALIGGNLLGIQQPRQRMVALFAALYLLSVLLIWIVPHLFLDQQFPAMQVYMVQYGLQLLPLLILLIRAPSVNTSSALAVDLFYSLMLFLLVAGLVLGSFAVKQVSHGDYAIALAQSLIVMAIVLMTLSWLWNPRSGFLGLGHLLSRYLMSLGLPFERWVKGVADLAETEHESARFLELALNSMCELPWVAGLSWRVPDASGEIGVQSGHRAEYSFQDLALTYHTRWSLSPALLLHLKLLTQMLGHFYHAKLREEVQRHNAYTQAIYETGARLTHDVKNLLQSLRSLCAAAESSSAGEAAALQALMQRQLPQITQRLTTTLDKLQKPQQQVAAVEVDAAVWWDAVRQRYARGKIRFTGRAQNGSRLPGELFDSVVENLLQNALTKAQREKDLEIEVNFTTREGATLTVSDTGKAIPPALITRLFNAPVPSQNGLGIGLFQAAKQAERLGFKLGLLCNADGRVCFELSKERGAQPR